MKAARLISSLLLALLLASTAQAHHVIWLDFSSFGLGEWSSVNGNTPPTANDVAAVRRLVVANMAKDYAGLDVYFTLVQPANGRYTRVRFLSTDQNGLFGCAGADCCPSGGTCTGIGTWDEMDVSACEVYSGSFSAYSEFTGSSATTARIANGISHTASHELGHVFDLEHCHAAADSISLGCSNAFSSTQDQNILWHTMASGSSWGLTMAQRATRDRFFAPYSSRRMLTSNFQARNHWSSLPNLNAGSGRADLAYGRVQSPTTTQWYGRLSSGSAFGSYTTWQNDAGDAGDIFLTGDVNNDARFDLVYGRIVSATQVRWYVRLSSGSGFGDYTVFANDAGDAGDIFRMADVNGDGRSDLVYGRPLDSNTVRWYVRLSTGSAFGSYTTWASDAGNEGDVFLVDDLDADGDADLAYGRTLSSTQVRWYARKSTGSDFSSFTVWRDDAGDEGDLFQLADVGGDGDADLVYGRVLGNTSVRWWVRGSTGSEFGGLQQWASDAGNAGDLFRLGDGNGDGRTDLLYGRPLGMTSFTATPDLNSVRWYGRLSTGGAFDSYTTWANDAGDEGDIFP
jgi:hypothetical protein